MLGFLLYLVIIGLVAGFLARLLVPGDDPMSVGATISSESSARSSAAFSVGRGSGGISTTARCAADQAIIDPRALTTISVRGIQETRRPCPRQGRLARQRGRPSSLRTTGRVGLRRATSSKPARS